MPMTGEKADLLLRIPEQRYFTLYSGMGLFSQ